MQECREPTIGVLLLLNRGRVGLTAGRLGKEEAAEHVIRRLVLVQLGRVATADQRACFGEEEGSSQLGSGGVLSFGRGYACRAHW